MVFDDGVETDRLRMACSSGSFHFQFYFRCAQVPISFKCPQCGKAYNNISDEFAGKRTKCKCGKVLKLGAAKPAATDANEPNDSTRMPVAPTPVQPTPVEPTAVQPIPVQPTPVQPVPVQPVAPVPIQPVPPAGDSLFGGVPQSGGGSVGDLLGAAGPPAHDPLGGGAFQAGYAPPAPVAAPPRKRARRRSSASNPAGPILSIIAGVCALAFGITIAILSINAMVHLIDAMSTISKLGIELPAGKNAQLIGALLAIGLNIVVTLGMAAAGGYSFVLGILELSNDYRKAVASKLALIICSVYAGLLIISKIVSIVMISTDNYTPLQRGVTNRFVLSSKSELITNHILFGFLFLIVPAFVIFVGIFRWNDDSK